MPLSVTAKDDTNCQRLWSQPNGCFGWSPSEKNLKLYLQHINANNTPLRDRTSRWYCRVSYVISKEKKKGYKMAQGSTCFQGTLSRQRPAWQRTILPNGIYRFGWEVFVSRCWKGMGRPYLWQQGGVPLFTTNLLGCLGETPTIHGTSIFTATVVRLPKYLYGLRQTSKGGTECFLKNLLISDSVGQWKMISCSSVEVRLGPPPWMVFHYWETSRQSVLSKIYWPNAFSLIHCMGRAKNSRCNKRS